MEQNMQFRTVGFGGFHRQDVLDYIARTSKEQSEQLEKLNKELEAAKAQAGERDSEMDMLRTQLDAARLQAEDLKEANAALEAEQAQLRQQVQERPAQVPQGQADEELRRQLEEAQEKAQRYEALKSAYADIELSAHQRALALTGQAQSDAQAIADQAQAQCDAVLAQANQQAEELLAQTRQQAEELLAQARQQAEETLAQANRQAEDTVAQASRQADDTVTKARAEAIRAREERRQLLTKTRQAFDAGNADLSDSLSASLREVDRMRQTLLDLTTAFEENAHTVDELCGGEV